MTMLLTESLNIFFSTWLFFYFFLNTLSVVTLRAFMRILSYFFKGPLCQNVFSHLEQANGFSPVWILTCICKLQFSVNDLSQLEQANGFSPVWLLSCFFNLPFYEKDLSHLEQANTSVLCGSFDETSNY